MLYQLLILSPPPPRGARFEAAIAAGRTHSESLALLSLAMAFSDGFLSGRQPMKRLFSSLNKMTYKVGDFR